MVYVIVVSHNCWTCIPYRNSVYCWMVQKEKNNTNRLNSSLIFSSYKSLHFDSVSASLRRIQQEFDGSGALQALLPKFLLSVGTSHKLDVSCNFYVGPQRELANLINIQ